MDLIGVIRGVCTLRFQAQGFGGNESVVEFFHVLVLLSSGFLITTGSFETTDLSANAQNALFVATLFPILYRKQLNTQFMQSEQLFSAFMDHLPGYAWIKNTDGSYLYINASLKQLPAYQHEWFGKTDEDLWPAELAAVYRANDLEVITTGKKVETVESFKLDGELRYILVSKFPIFDEQGTVIVVAGTGVDITEQKRVGEALRESESFRRMIVEAEPECVKLVAPDYTLLDVNPAGLEMIEATSREQVVGQSVLNLIAPECRSTFIGMHRRVCQGESVVSEFKIIGLKGSHRWMQSHAAPLLDKESRVIAQLAITRDVTERKRAEQALRQAEQKYRELFENAKDAIYVHDLSGRYTSINHAAEKLSGYPRDEILGKKFTGFVAPEFTDFVLQKLCKKLREHGETTYEVEIITKDGRRVPVEVSSRLIYEDGVPVAVQGTARNILERKRAEEALRGYSRLLIRAQEAERESISRELHDQIGQVLTAIRINLETIRASSNKTESDALIDEGVSIVDRAIKQVRDLSFELRPSLLDDLGLSAALRWYADRYAQRTGVKTQTLICPESRMRLPRDLETACFRIVQEALTNVARHAQAKNVSIDVKTLNGALSLSIKDDGIGFNLHSQTNRELLNSLGLRGMEERAHELGGKLEIDSLPHKGTEVKVYFPNGGKRKKSS